MNPEIKMKKRKRKKGNPSRNNAPRKTASERGKERKREGGRKKERGVRWLFDT
jgi:hypothetical protein